MNFSKVALVVMSCLSCSFASAQTTVLEHDFENGTPGDLSAAADLGAPVAGTLTATGGFVSTTRPAWTTGTNGMNNLITTVPGGTFDDVGTPAGNYLTARLSQPAAVSGVLGAGETTTISFNLASFGTNNATSFKYTHIVGLSSTGDEVFQLLWRSGSTPFFREVYARELGQDNTTFVEQDVLDPVTGLPVLDPITGLPMTVGAFDSVDGTLVLSGVNFNINSTNNDAAPAGQVVVTVTIDDAGWGASATPTAGGTNVDSTGETPATGLAIASGATDLASIVFFSSQNSINGGQNNGVWIDNLLVQTDQTVMSGVLKGDLDLSGTITFLDINPFISVLAAGGFQAEADCDCDGDVDFLDIQPFIDILATQ